MKNVKSYKQIFVREFGSYNLFPNYAIRKELNTNGFFGNQGGFKDVAINGSKELRMTFPTV